MLNGPLGRKILRFAVPLAATSILQQLFNAADIAVVGQFAGDKALAAVGANTFVINMLINLFVGISVGVNVVVANSIGAQSYRAITRSVHTSVIVSFISGILLSFIGVFFARPILSAISTPADVLDLAVRYLQQKGYDIVERDWHSNHRDIDIIAHLDGTLVFVEVKTRSNRDFSEPESSVNYQKQKNLRQSVNHYIKSKCIDLPWRFDVITIVGKTGCKEPEINHIEDFFLT